MNEPLDPDRQEQLVRSIARDLSESAHPAQLFQTHISWIIVTDRYAYKFKKAVHFDFLDFSSLAARHFYCQEELRLNRRTAPDLYLDVVQITGSAAQPVIGGAVQPIEYAVKMRAFPQSALWTERIAGKCLSNDDIDALVNQIAHLHQVAAHATLESQWGTMASLEKTAQENIRQIAELSKALGWKSDVDALIAWQQAQHRKLNDTFIKRKVDGFVRECHGDLHSGNILTIDGQVMMFDCIEFNENLRWIDVMNDVAFIVMDLQERGLHAFAARLLNQYLELTGDYEGGELLNYYLIQRALVRCKVVLLQSVQTEGNERETLEAQAEDYLRYAIRMTQPASVAIIITHGLSGSGKTTVARYMVELLGAVQIRSDVERKRLHGVAATTTTAAPVHAGFYTQAATDATYGRLCDLTKKMIASGMTVIVDASFLHQSQRIVFKQLAAELGVPFYIADVVASDATLRSRVAARTKKGGDASDAGLDVLAYQILHRVPMEEPERRFVVTIDGDAGLSMALVQKACAPIANLLRKNKPLI